MSHLEVIVAPSKHVVELLEAGSPKVGTFNGKKNWGIYIANTPDRPANVITIFDTVVRQTTYPINKLGPDDRVEYPGIQAMVRALEYDTAFSKVNQIINEIANKGEFIKDGFRYLNIYKQTDALYLGELSKGRHSFSANFMAVRTPTT